MLGLSEYHACTPHSFYPGEIYLTENSNILLSCNNDVNIDYKDADFHNFQLLDILKGRSNQLLNNFRKINSNKNSRIIIIITSHGGENFIKVRGKSVILSDELNRALNEMHIKQRYKEILFILDTCEAESLFEYVDVPNVYFVASSLKHQKAHSYSYDTKYMAPTADKFHFKLYNILKRIHQEKSFKTAIHSIFLEIKSQQKFLETDVAIDNKIEREIIFEDFFGNYLKEDHYNVNYKFGDLVKEDSEINKNNIQNFNSIMNDEREKLDKEVLEIKLYNQKSYYHLENQFKNSHIADSQITRELINLKNLGSCGFIILIVIYLIIKLIKY